MIAANAAGCASNGAVFPRVQPERAAGYSGSKKARFRRGNSSP
jgi:hypothetical protein